MSMSTPDTRHNSTYCRTSRRDWLLHSARVLLVVFGLVGLGGATYFTFFASAAEGGVVTAFDWFVAFWKLAVCVGFVAMGVLPGLPRDLRISAAIWLVAADVVFGLVKLVGYQEMTALGFFVVDAAIFALLHLARRR